MRLTVARDEGEAEVICGMLRLEDIRCFHRPTDIAAHAAVATPMDWHEVLVDEHDFARARELVEATVEPTDACSRCGREIGEEGGWYPDEARELHPYCGVCAERLFGDYGLRP